MAGQSGFNGLTPAGKVIAIAVSLAVLFGMVYGVSALLTSTHDACATSHPDIREQVKAIAETNKVTQKQLIQINNQLIKISVKLGVDDG